MKTIYLAVAFLLELCMLASLCFWGFHAFESIYLKILFGIGLPLAVAFLWGYFAAPRSRRRLRFEFRLFFESVLFIASALLLYMAGQDTLALIFLGMTTIKEIVSVIYRW